MRYVPIYHKDECFHIRNFIMGLNNQIIGEVDIHGPTTMDLVYEKAIKQEQELKANSSHQESRDHKKVVKVPDKLAPKKVEVVQNVPRKREKGSRNGGKEDWLRDVIHVEGTTMLTNVLITFRITTIW